MNLSAPFILRPVMTTFVIFTIVLAGWIAYLKLPITDLPPVERPHIQVSAGYLGASPETVLNQVTIPLEKELTHVKGVQDISSTSSQGASSVSLAFDLDKDMNEAVRDVQSALNRAQAKLPTNLDPKPTYQLQEDSQEPIMYLLLTSDQASQGELRKYAESYIIPRFNRIEGVAQVVTFGAQKSIWLRLNPELMAARQIGFNQVVAAIKQYTEEMPLGTIQTSSKKLSIEWPKKIKQWKDFENLKIGNTSVRFKDIGEFSETSGEDKKFHFIKDSKTSLVLCLGIQKVSDANTVAISKAVQNVVEGLNKELPSYINLQIWFDKAIWIEESLMDVQWSLLFAFALVFLVIFFSLGRLSESVITSVALPLSLVGTFAIMYLLHFSLNLLSLLALTLAVGFVVDDAIVALENIVRHQQKGESRLNASLNGSKQISFTILSMTLSLVAVFIPLLFMPGMNGRLFREFSITLAVAILVSGFVSLTVTPMLCSRFLTHAKENRFQRLVTVLNDATANLYGKTLKYCFRFSKTILFFALICIGATIFLFTKLPVNLIPPEDRGFLFAFVNLPLGMAPEQFNMQQTKLESLIQGNSNVESFLSINFEGNLLFVLKLHPFAQRPPQFVVMSELQKMLDAIPGTLSFVRPYQMLNLDLDFGNAGQYEFIVRGQEFIDVERATQNLVKAFQSNAQFSFVQNSIRNDSPILVMNVNEDMAHQFGFEKQEIQTLLQHAYGQGSVGKLQNGTFEEKIYMELQPEFKNHLNAPAKLYLNSTQGDYVPFKALAEWKEKLGSPSLERRDQLPAAIIRFSLSDTISPSEGLHVTEKIAAQTLPGNVSGVLGGAAKATASTIKYTLILLLAAAIVMYVVLGILYESFIHPLTILSSIPFAGLGGVLTLFLFSEPVSIFSAVGFLLLIGIVKKKWYYDGRLCDRSSKNAYASRSSYL